MIRHIDVVKLSSLRRDNIAPSPRRGEQITFIRIDNKVACSHLFEHRSNQVVADFIAFEAVAG